MKIAKEHLPHLVILDVMMPQVDGIEICRDMRQIPSLNNTIITFLTARSETYSVMCRAGKPEPTIIFLSQ